MNPEEIVIAQLLGTLHFAVRQLAAAFQWMLACASLPAH